MDPTAGGLAARAGLDAGAPEWLSLALGLCGGLALFLYGLDQMTVALKKVAGNRLRSLLAQLTTNRLAGLATGAVVTATIQSSSVTTVLLVSFISSGLMTLGQAVPVILGADIGTTITAQIVAFKVTKLSMFMIAAGFGVAFLARRDTVRQQGNGLLGLGLVFLGMTLMAEAMAPLRGYPPVVDWMVQMDHLVLGVLAAAAFTALVQSSSATTGVVIAMASGGLITLPTGIALVFGANIGTCVTALLAAIGKPREAVRAALVHVMFKVVGVALWIGFIPQFAELITWLSPTAADLSGSAKLAADTPRQIANAHTLFNVVNAFVFLPFAGLVTVLAERMVPDRPLVEEELLRAKYLDDALLDTPVLALERARHEIVRIGGLVVEMLEAVLPAMVRGDDDALRNVEERDEAIDALHRHVVGYLGRLSQSPLDSRQTVELLHLVGVANALENAADVIETDLVRGGRGRVGEDVVMSEETIKLIETVHGEVHRGLVDAIAAVDSVDVELANQVIALKPEVQRLGAVAVRHHMERLMAPEAKRLPAFAIETDMIEDLRRIYYFAKRIAHSLIELGPSNVEA